MEKQYDDLQALKVAYKILDEKFGSDIVALDIHNVSVMADYFIIVSGNNINHLSSLCDAVEEALAKIGILLKSKEGAQNSTWILLDFGDIIVHIFNKEDREFYNLERVWGDAKQIDLNSLNA